MTIGFAVSSKGDCFFQQSVKHPDFYRNHGQKVRHPRRSRWLNEWDRLKGGRPHRGLTGLSLELSSFIR
ncbi:hypothetical protein, partial [Leptolyngbya sp. FACHB-16]|uniref:hypothetical protein n=1 Tax=Leptolyngbya sp. FACHB-16 TaxID=2692800 RepID=UPI001A7E9B16